MDNLFNSLFSGISKKVDEANCAESFLDKIYNLANDIEAVDENDIESLSKAKKDISQCVAEIKEKIDNDSYFASMMRIAEILFGTNVVTEFEHLLKYIDAKIEEWEEEHNPKELNITAELIRDEIAQKIYVNKKSDEKQALQLCGIIADFLNTANPKLQDTDEDRAKLTAAANLLFGFADFTLFK